MVSDTRSDLGSGLKDKIRFFFKSLACKVRVFPMDFGQITLHDCNNWFEMPEPKKASIDHEKNEFQNSDILVYFDNLNVTSCVRVLQNV